jgi:DNA-binding NarL/FixJ family response regulator
VGSSALRTVLVVEDDRLLASLIATMLEGENFVVHIAHDVPGATHLLKILDPDIALLDVNLGDGPSGIHLGQLIAMKYPGVGIVFLTQFPDLNAAGIDPRSLPTGSAVAGKDRLDAGKDLLDAIDSVLASTKEPVRHDREQATALTHLTSHQLGVLKQVASGMTNFAIAHENNTTERSVERTLHNIFSRLGIDQSAHTNPRVEATRRYIAHLGLPPKP